LTKQNKRRNFVKQIRKRPETFFEKIRLSVRIEFHQINWWVIGVVTSSLNDKDIGPCIVHKINYESRIKWIGSVTDLRFGKPNLSTQAGYRITFSTEVNDVGKVVKRLGDVGRLIEVGTPIGITRRNIAKNKIIRFYYCVFQYDRILKTERYDNKRVVPTLSLINFYQGVNHEVILKYGDGDISRSSLVFRCSKDNEAERRTTTSINPRHKNFTEIK
jgi:hypothetical protein